MVKKVVFNILLSNQVETFAIAKAGRLLRIAAKDPFGSDLGLTGRDLTAAARNAYKREYLFCLCVAALRAFRVFSPRAPFLYIH
jgi:hypothetical protein